MVSLVSCKRDVYLIELVFSFSLGEYSEVKMLIIWQFYFQYFEEFSYCFPTWLHHFVTVVVVQLLSHVQLFAVPWTAAHWAFLSFTVPQSLLKLMSTESVIPSKHLIPCCPLLLLPSVFSNIRVFSSESVLCIRWPMYWSFSFSFSIRLSSEYSGLISFRIDWLDPFAVQGTLKSLLQHHNWKASILPCSIFFMVQLSHLYMLLGKP